MRRILVLLLLLVPLLAACGGADADGAIRRAVAATRAARTADVTLRIDATGLGAGSLAVTARGSIDLADQRSAVTAVAAGQLRVEERIIGTKRYLRSPQWSQGDGALPPGNWLALDVDQASRQAGLDLAPVQLGNDDPAAGITALAGAVRGGAQRFGHDTIAGVRTTHYRVKVDLHGSRVTADAWIDDHDLVRRTVVPLPLPKDAGDVRAAATTDYEHFGTAVDIQAPPPAQVTSYADLLR